jgi:hypothetical protein
MGNNPFRLSHITEPKMKKVNSLINFFVPCVCVCFFSRLGLMTRKVSTGIEINKSATSSKKQTNTGIKYSFKIVVYDFK